MVDRIGGEVARHLDRERRIRETDPLRRASEHIGSHLAGAIGHLKPQLGEIISNASGQNDHYELTAGPERRLRPFVWGENAVASQ